MPSKEHHVDERDVPQAFGLYMTVTIRGHFHHHESCVLFSGQVSLPSERRHAVEAVLAAAAHEAHLGEHPLAVVGVDWEVRHCFSLAPFAIVGVLIDHASLDEVPTGEVVLLLDAG